MLRYGVQFRVIPHLMNMTQKLRAVFRALLSSGKTLAVHDTVPLPTESSSVKIRQQMHQMNAGVDEISKSEGLPPICTFDDFGTIEDPPQEQTFDEWDSEIPVVDWEYMLPTIPEKTWEDLAEEQLWDDYTQQHSPPVGAIVWEEFVESSMEESISTEDVTEVELDAVVVHGHDGEYHNCVDVGIDVHEFTKTEEESDSKSGTKGKKRWRRWNPMSRFSRMMGSLIKHDVW